MFNLFGGKKGNTNTLTIIRLAASALQMHIHRIQEELTTVLESKGRATKDERTTIVMSSLNTLKKVDDFLYEVGEKTQ